MKITISKNEINATVETIQDIVILNSGDILGIMNAVDEVSDKDVSSAAKNILESAKKADKELSEKYNYAKNGIIVRYDPSKVETALEFELDDKIAVQFVKMMARPVIIKSITTISAALSALTGLVKFMIPSFKMIGNIISDKFRELFPKEEQKKKKRHRGHKKNKHQQGNAPAEAVKKDEKNDEKKEDAKNDSRGN